MTSIHKLRLLLPFLVLQVPCAIATASNGVIEVDNRTGQEIHFEISGLENSSGTTSRLGRTWTLKPGQRTLSINNRPLMAQRIYFSVQTNWGKTFWRSPLAEVGKLVVTVTARTTRDSRREFHLSRGRSLRIRPEQTSTMPLWEFDLGNGQIRTFRETVCTRPFPHAAKCSGFRERLSGGGSRSVSAGREDTAGLTESVGDSFEHGTDGEDRQ